MSMWGDDDKGSSLGSTMMSMMMMVVGLAMAANFLGALQGMTGGTDVSPHDLTGTSAITPTPTPGMAPSAGQGIGV